MSNPGADSQVLRFAVTGLMNAAFGISCYVVLLLVGFSYPGAIAVSTIAGVLFNFATNSRFVFRVRKSGLLLRFLAAYGTLYAVNVGGVAVLKSVGLTSLSAGLAMVAPIASLAYLLQSRWVFR